MHCNLNLASRGPKSARIFIKVLVWLVCMLAWTCCPERRQSSRLSARWRCRLKCVMPGCGTPYAMQPVNDPARKAHNPNPKWEVPWELIEWQASYTQAVSAHPIPHACGMLASVRY